MKLLSPTKLIVPVLLTVLVGSNALACTCGSSFQNKNEWESAKLEAERATAIFEGTLQHAKMDWDLLAAKDGELVSAGMWRRRPDEGPGMVLTFHVQRAYKGALGSDVRLRTGLGGGDCGALFETGLTYLVYGQGPDLNHLGVRMCSPGGWIGDNAEATRLRFLRKEHPMKADFSLPRRWTDKETLMQVQQRERAHEDAIAAYASATGRICGSVIRKQSNDDSSERIWFLPTTGYSPFSLVPAAVATDGSFCSGNLGPGEYSVLFESWFGSARPSSTYYPGTNDRVSAAKIEVAPGRTKTITFPIPDQKAYSVYGCVSADDKSDLSGNDVGVALLQPDGRIRYTQDLNFEGLFPLPKVKCFRIKGVTPGRYIAYVSGGSNTYTRKREVNVTAGSQFISLELLHKK